MSFDGRVRSDDDARRLASNCATPARTHATPRVGGTHGTQLPLLLVGNVGSQPTPRSSPKKSLGGEEEEQEDVCNAKDPLLLSI